MTHDHFFNSLSADFEGGPGFTEEELLAYVEGELNPDRADTLSLQLLSDPQLFRQLEQMRINRSLLMSLPQELAPPDLMERVTLSLEQQTLLDSPLEAEISPTLKLVSDGTPLGGMRRMEYSGPAWYQSRAAMAAGVLLLLSGGLYWGWTAVRSLAPAHEPIALVPQNTPMDRGAGSLGPDIVVETGSGTVAEATTPEEDPIRALVDAAGPSPADMAAAISMPDRIITPDQAAQLARDGRLAIRVATLNADRAAQQVSKLTAVKPEASRSWRLGTDLPAHVLESVVSAAEPSQNLATAAPALDIHPELLAGDAVHADASKFERSTPQLPLQARPVARKPVGFVVEVDAASSSLSAVKGLLAEKAGAVATFIELPEPVDAGCASDPDSIMWFTQTPDNWVPRVRVPILVGR